MRFQFLGCGDAFGSGGRFQTCFHVAGREAGFLIDCGASSLVALKRHGVDPNAVSTILITHLHGDHFGGLPFLLLDAQLVSRRRDPLVVAGPPGLRKRLTEAMECFFPGSSGIDFRFPLEIRELEPKLEHGIGPITVRAQVVKHQCGAPPLALRIRAEGRVIAYTGDTEWVDPLVEVARGADLFVAETYTHSKSVKWHLDWASLRGRLAEIAAKRVYLTHMGQDMLSRPPEDGVFLAEDGLVVEL